LQLSPIDKSNAYESVQRELLRVVVSGSVQIGDKLPSEKAMADALGVSRPVVREALGSLRALGLIESRTGRGSFVISTTPSSLPKRLSMLELLEARSLIEIPTVRLAAHRRPAKHVAAMAAAVGSMEATTDGGIWEVLDGEFHAALARASENRVLVDLSHRVHRDFLREMGISLRSDSRIGLANTEHREICNAVLAGNVEAAARAMEIHLQSILEEAVAMYGDEPLDASEWHSNLPR
jgi:DNA-binding FadR family transcriptional regulator